MGSLPNEQFLSAKAGDCVVLHSDTLHSTTVNVAAHVRYFVSAYFTRFGLPHRDEFDTPAVRMITNEARSAVSTDSDNCIALLLILVANVRMCAILAGLRTINVFIATC